MNINITSHKMNLAVQFSRYTRYISASSIPLTGFNDVFTYLGYIKDTYHYVNNHNEVYIKSPDGGMEYVADWLHDHKMLWTDHPISYRLITHKSMNYFYDIDYKDAYYYDKDMDLVLPAGYYDPKLDTFRQSHWL
tara:strand:- start:181 stop:585 length:405 start_codon:yes stop_codon:yes gene_type:complete